jgi:phosphatidylglycerol lysyltransferase
MPDRHFSPRAPRRATFSVLRVVLPVAILAATLPPLAAHFAATDAVAVAAALSAVTPVALIAALGATALSLAAVGRYETGIHRWLGTGADRVDAARVGAASVAISQTLGFGLVTGAFARWRGLPGLTLLGAGRATLAVTVTFMAALAVLVIAATLLLGRPAAAPVWVVLPGGAVLLLVPVLSLAPHRFDGAMPPLGLLATLLAVAAVDVAAAGAAFWLLLPPDPALAFAAVLPAFTLALAAVCSRERQGASDRSR